MQRSHSSADLTLPFVGFELGFAGSVGCFALLTSGIFDGTAGSGSVYWFGFWFLVGCAMTCVGAGLFTRRLLPRVAPGDRPTER